MSKRGFPPAGEEFGALRLSSLQDLYGDQGRAAKEIIREVHEIAVAAFAKRPRVPPRDGRDGHTRLDAPVGSDPSDFHRPHHTYVIDGRRGSGKTSVLLTLYPYLCALRLGRGLDGRRAGDLSETIHQDLRELDLTAPSGAQGESVALVLPIVFTEDMELQETTMEAIFALMEHELDERILRAGDDPERKRLLSALREDLRLRVGVAWTYSRKIGAETLPNDALDYDDFVVKRAGLSRKAYTKVMTWRRFLDRYLDALGHQVLVLLFDDSDLNPAIAEDLIRAVRMYLSHPRVVSIVAVDLETLRKTLLARSVAHHEIVHLPSTFTEDSVLDSLKEEAVHLEDENTGHLLGKVLPRPNRHRLAMEDLRHLDRFFDENHSGGLESGDAAKDRFGRFCRNRFAETADGTDRLAWWFLHGPYRRMVAGDLRAIISFRRQVQVGAHSPIEAIFDRYELSDLFERTDGSLAILGRMVEGNEFDATTPEGSLEESETRFIDLWLDSRMAAGGLASGPMGIVASWLPTSSLAGEARELTDEGRTLGVSSLLRGDLAPRNCLYLHQFRHIEKVLEDILPEPSPFARWLATGIEASSIREGATRLLGKISPDGADERFVLRRPLIGVRNLLRGVTITGTLAGAETVFEQTASEALAAIIVAAHVRPSRSRKRNAGIATIRMALESVIQDLETHPDGEAGFAERLSSALSRHERLRQETLVSWACANEIVALGDDMTRLSARSAPRSLISSVASPSPAGNLSRFPVLARATVERAEGKGARHRLLHAWSLLPLIGGVYHYGADYLRGPDTRPSWESIATLLEAAVSPFKGEQAGPDADGWSFPDVPWDLVAEFVREVEEGTERLREDLDATPPAGSASDGAGEPGDDAFWAHEPERRLAYLLGTSDAWVRQYLFVPTDARS